MTKDEFYNWVMEVYRPVEAMIRMVPPDKLDWRPRDNFMSFGQLVCHLGDGLGHEMQSLFAGKWPYSPAEMQEKMKLDNCPSCSPQEAIQKLNKDKKTLKEVLAGISEQDFGSRIVSTPWNWKGKCELMSYRMLEHFLHHKMQLFTYLKLTGLPVHTGTLYFGE